MDWALLSTVPAHFFFTYTIYDEEALIRVTKKIIEEFDESGNLVKRTTIKEDEDTVWKFVPWFPERDRTDVPWEPMCDSRMIDYREI